jgi:hypothetical protein
MAKTTHSIAKRDEFVSKKLAKMSLEDYTAAAFVWSHTPLRPARIFTGDIPR